MTGRFYIEKVPAKWIVMDRGMPIGTYLKRDEARFAKKTAQLQHLCDNNAKSRGVFQPNGTSE